MNMVHSLKNLPKNWGAGCGLKPALRDSRLGSEFVDRALRLVVTLSLALSWVTGLIPSPVPQVAVHVAYAVGGGGWITNVSLNGQGDTITAPPGAVIPIDLDYTIQNPDYCPSCIQQLVIGIGDEAQYCAYDGIPAVYPGTTSGHSIDTITVPATRGKYSLTFSRHYQFSCADAMAAHTAQQTIGTITSAFELYVDADATGANDGTSWADAYTDLQSALATAVPGIEIWVAEGTYYPTIQGLPWDTFQLVSDVALYGGFAATETLRTQRDWVAHPTILSGDLNGDDGPNFANRDDNSYNVVTAVEVTNAVLDGFTVTGGNANGVESPTTGAGVYNFAGDITLRHIILTGNTAGWAGGGIRNEGTVNLWDCTLTGNTANYGGGISSGWYTTMTLVNTTVSNNQATWDGGGIYNDGDATLINVIVSGNESFGDSGGIRNFGVLDATNCVIANNIAVNGGGLSVSPDEGMPGQATLYNTTVYSNSASIGGGLYNQDGLGSIALHNTVVAGSPSGDNCTGTITDVGYNLDDGASCGLWMVTSLSNTDPQFADAPGGDLRLQLTSPAVDAGDNDAVPPDFADLDGDGDTAEATPLDLAGLPRFLEVADAPNTGNGTSPIVDMGAYEVATCFATPDDGSTVYNIIQGAVDAASPGGTVKVAGTCAGVESRVGLLQTAYLSQSLTVRGGYTFTNWAVSDPLANPTTLDALGGGRVAYIDSGADVALKDLSLTGGSIAGNGGGIHHAGAGLTLNDTIVFSNAASGDGGGVYVMAGNATLSGTQILSNTAAGNGGGIYHAGASLILSNTTVFSNTAIEGGGLYNTGTALIIHTTLVSNTAASKAGAIRNVGSGSLTIDHSTLSGNVSGGSGGAIDHGAPALTISETVIADNHSYGGFGGGGLIVSSGNVDLIASSVLNNEATGGSEARGGGVRNLGATLTIANSTIAGNRAAAPSSRGGGVLATSGATIIIVNSTIANNGAEGTSESLGGGICTEDPSAMVTLKNTIVANSASGGNCYSPSGVIDDGGSNLSWPDASCPGLNQDPNLDPTGPKDNGGATPTIALLPDSPAIDAGTCVGSSVTDQRGQPRPGSGTASCDIGAFELQGVTVDLALAKSVTPAEMTPGQTIAYTLVFSNAGVGKASSVTITDIVPVSVTVTGVVSSGAAIADTGVRPGYVWAVQDLAPNQGGIITITGVVNPGLGGVVVFTNTATIASTAVDADATNDTGTVGITVHDVPIAGLAAANSGPTTLGHPTTFTATIAAGGNVTYQWAFGDGFTASGATVFHTYAAAGAYTATVTATNGGGSAAATTIVVITNLPPVADAGPNQGVLVNELVTLDGSASSDPDGHLALTYDWTQTGGTPVVLSSNTASQPTFSAPGVPDILAFTLTVTDARGLADPTPDQVFVSVGGTPIAGLAAANSSPTPLGQPTFFTATVTAGSNVIYQWAFGDGGTADGVTAVHTYTTSGMVTAIVTATNGASTAAAATLVTIANNSRAAAQPISGTVTLSDAAASITDTNWYKVHIAEPGSILSVILSNLIEDYDLFLFAPEIDEDSGQLRDIGVIGTGVIGTGVIGTGVIGTGVIGTGVIGTGVIGTGVIGTGVIGTGVIGTGVIGTGLVGNIPGSGGINTLVGISANPLTATEQIVYDVREFYGDYYIAVSGHNPGVAGQPYVLDVLVTPPTDPYPVITETVPPTFTTPLTDTSVRTLILFNGSRLGQLYGSEAIAAAQLITRLNALKDDPNVNGVLVNLDGYPEIVSAYQVWDAQPGNPRAANLVAMHIKSLLYSLKPAYPNLKYLVIVGDDRVIPHCRIQDEALVSNERSYAAVAYTPIISGALAARFFLSDDYYAGLLPLLYRGRELYLPQLAIGRLVEKPAEIATAIDAFLRQPMVKPTDALVTGYDFLIDEAQSVSDTLAGQGIAPVTTLINDAWTADNLRTRLISVTAASDLNSLNAHFAHFALIPASVPVTPTLNDYVFATEITGTTNYDGSLIFSVGCHSGLNVPDEESASLESGTDWAQAFLRQGATLIGNTGYGYGDSETIAYSERLMVSFAEQLGNWEDGPQTVGNALMRAKQRYYNDASAGSFSTYDEKVLGEATLYGLPMLRVDMPFTSTTGGATSASVLSAAEEVTTTTRHFSFTYVPHTVTGSITGTYYTIAGQHDYVAVAGLPVQPRASASIQVSGTVAHGALLVGGTFSERPIDPLISTLLTDELGIVTEPAFAAGMWVPAQLGTVNRLLLIDGRLRERLVVVPGQFLATTTATPTLGIQRLYSDLDFVIYHAPLTATDFIAPSIWEVEAISTSLSLRFRVLEDDDSGVIQRTVVLYRQLDEDSWSKAELTADPATGWAEGSVPPVDGPIEYFVQAVDPTGNVALALDHWNPFRGPENGRLLNLYMPAVSKNHVFAPDLVVERIVAASDAITVVIQNQGNAPVLDPFWVDVYVNPNPVPTHVNQVWNDLASQGLVWGVTASLQPGQALTLTVGDAYYVEEYSQVTWPLAAGTPVYAQVDSAGDTTYGGVLESHEIAGGAYNNVLGPVGVTAAAGAAGVKAPAIGDRPLALMGGLPQRR